MSSKDVQNKFNEINNNNQISCTESEVEEFLMYGILFKTKDNKYLNKYNQEITVDLIKVKTQTFNLDLSNIISVCEELVKNDTNKKVYCMNERCYNKYNTEGLIIKHNNKEYYRMFDKELWLVNKI